LSAGDKKKLDALIRAVQFSPPTLIISQRPDEVTIVSPGREPETLATSGARQRQAIDGGEVERSAGWEGPILLVSYDAGKVGSLIYRYSLVPTTKQLLIRINFERVPGRLGPFDVKLVYNRTPSRP
jgi:hypothetical protein